MKTLTEKLQGLVEELASEQDWTSVCTPECHAISTLRTMARLGIIEHKEHPSGGDVWRFNGHIYGRTDNFKWHENK